MACQCNPCQNNGACNINPITAGYICSCLAGFSGANCQNVVTNPCLYNPCLNNGKSVSKLTFFLKFRFHA